MATQLWDASVFVQACGPASSLFKCASSFQEAEGVWRSPPSPRGSPSSLLPGTTVGQGPCTWLPPAQRGARAPQLALRDSARLGRRASLCADLHLLPRVQVLPPC